MYYSELDAIMAIFSLTRSDVAVVTLLSICSGSLGVVVALMLPSLAKNRVEGMAVLKMSGLVMLGLPVALLLPSPFKYLAGVLPSFWITQLIMGEGLWNALPALFTAALLALGFIRRFAKRVL